MRHLPLIGLLITLVAIAGCVNGEPPSIDRISITPEQPQAGNAIDVSVQASDDKGLASLAIRSGTFQETQDCGGQTSCTATWSIALETAGTHTVTIVAVDTNNKQRATETRQVVVGGGPLVCDNDGICETGENAQNCPADCVQPPACGNGVCDAGETSASCPADCPVEGRYTTDNFGLFDLPNDPRSFDLLDELGAGWVRVQFRLGEKNLNTLTSVTDQLFQDQKGLWLTIHYRNRDNIADQAGLDASTRGSYPPMDQGLYKQEVAEVVDALIDQMQATGLDPEEQLIVQFSNEVAPADVAPDSPSRYFHGSGDEYLTVLELTHDAVKSTGFDIPVAAGGISSGSMELILDYEAGIAPESKAVKDWNDRMLREGTYDWMDVHIRNEIERIDDKIGWIRERWSGPIAATEVGGLCDSGCSDADIAAYTEDVQAADLPVRMETLLENGVDIVFWASLVESPDQEPQYEVEGLLRENWVKKPAFDAYKNLIAELTG